MFVLQDAYNRFARWAELNKLSINNEKTCKITFYTKEKLDTRYYHGMDQIAEVEEMWELGVLFDQKCRFDGHINYISRSCRRMMGALCRFVKSTNTKKLAKQIFATYLSPIIEYASPLLTPTYEQRAAIDKPHKLATRIALTAPHDHRNPRYIPYIERCARLDQMPPTDRMRLQAAMFVMRHERSSDDITLVAEIGRFKHIPRANTRHPLLFDVGRNIHGSHLLKAPMLTINTCYRSINFGMSLNVLRRRMRRMLMAERQN